MKKLIISLITFIIIFNCIDIIRAENYAKFEDAINKYILEYPSSWELIKTPNSKNLIKAQINQTKQSGVQVRIYNNNKPFNEFLDWYIKDYKNQMLGHHSGTMVVLSEKATQPNELKSYNYTVNFTNNKNQQWFIKQYLWPRGNKVYLMQCGTEYAKKDAFEKTIDNIAGSFRFTK